MVNRVPDSDGSPNSTNAVLEGMFSSLRSGIPLKDRRMVEELASGITVTYPKGSWVSTIADAKVACEFPDVSKKISLLGTDREGMVNFYGSGSYAPNWKADINDGTVGQVIYGTSSFGAEFWVFGSQLWEINSGKFDDDAHIKVWVDDRPLTDLPVTPDWVDQTGNSTKIELPDLMPHKIRIFFDKCSLGKIWCSPGGSIWPAERDSLTRLVVLGDSLTAGSEENKGGELGTWLPRFASYLNISDYWNASIYGTGPIGFNNYVDRAYTDVAPTEADVVLVGSWNNSRNEPVANIKAAYVTLIQSLRAMPSQPEVVLFGSPDPSGEGDAPYSTVDNAVRATAAEQGVPYISALTGTVYDEDGLPVYISEPWITVDTKGTIVGADETHPDDLGQKYFAIRMLESYRALMSS